MSKSSTREKINALKTNKRYKTTNINNHYTAFCELGLALAKPNGGVVTMIVPLSIAFGQRHRSLRVVFENICQEISLRHYDNRPDTTFNASPTVKSPENRQRATIFTVRLGDSPDPIIRSSGLQRWPVSERNDCLTQRRTTILPKIGSGVDTRVAGQWLRTPSSEVARLVETIVLQDRTVMSYEYTDAESDSLGKEFLAFPQTAYQFIGVIPAGTVSPRRETLFRVKDRDTLRLLMAALNGHVGYAWWWMVGDGFHVKPIADHGTLTIPNIWTENPRPAIDMGQKLIQVMPECMVVANQQGNSWKNVNFHRKPDLIEELDRLHLEALGFKGAAQNKLLKHLRIMRSSSSWKYD